MFLSWLLFITELLDGASDLRELFQGLKYKKKQVIVTLKTGGGPSADRRLMCNKGRRYFLDVYLLNNTFKKNRVLDNIIV